MIEIDTKSGLRVIATILLTGYVALTVSGCGSSGTASSAPAAPTLNSIAVTPANQSIPVNATQQFTAMGTYSDTSTKNLTSQVSWSSSASSVATVSASGLATGVASGTANIVATMGTVNGSRSLTVTPILMSITVAPASPSAVVNTTQQFTATGFWSDGSSQDVSAEVTWASSDSTIASIDNTGMATGVAAGAATISATMGAIAGSTMLTVTAPTLTSIVITPDQASVPRGISQPFVATGIFNNGDSEDLASATWGSSDSTIASIDNSGNAPQSA